MKLPLPLVSALLLAGFVTASAATAADYAVRLTRTSTVGDKYHVVAHGTDEQVLKVQVDGQDQPPNGQNVAIDFEADAEVLGLTASKREARSQFTVVKLTVTVSGAPQATELLPAGSVIVAERGSGKTTFTKDGTPVAPQLAQALEMTGISMATDDEASDDQVFGTTDKKAVGASWPVNAAAAIPDLVKQGIPATAANLSGTTTLKEVVTVGNQPCLRVTGTMVLKDVNPPMPPGVTIQSSNFTIDYAGLFPVDPAKPLLEQSTAMNFDVVANGDQGGKKVVLSMTKKGTRNAKFTRK